MDTLQAENKPDSALIQIKHSTSDTYPDATLSVLGLPVNQVDSILFFQLCSSYTSENLTFENVSATSTTNSVYTISWGDGSENFRSTSKWTTQSHLYKAGHWVLTYKVDDLNGNSSTQIYHIYIVSNPAVSLGTPGNTDNCSGVPLTFPITGAENNPPNTTYTITFNDGTPSLVFKNNPPAEITHTFTKSSCGITSYNGSTPYPNSFSASIVASNSCGVSAVNVVPIYISTSPVVDFDLPKTTISTTKQIYVTNKTTGYVNVGANCSVVPKLVWKITPSTGFTLSSGSLGNDYNSDNSTLWTKGSDIIVPVFTTPGVYHIKLRVDTKRCGNDSIVKTICVEGSLSPQFTVDATEGCSPLHVSATNITDLSKTCSSAVNWSVAYTPGFGGTASSWTYSSGNSATSPNTAFDFVNPGTYKIRLTMTNTSGSYYVEKSVIVKQHPIVNIKSISDFCGSAVIHPVAVVNSCTPSVNSLTYKWEFPGAVQPEATTFDPGQVIYNTPGTYSVKLTVTNECGSATAVDTFVVNDIPVVNDVASQLKSVGQLSENIIFSGTTGTVYSWTNNNSKIGLSASGKGDIAPFILLNTSDSVMRARITVTPMLPKTGCVGVSKTFEIVVNPSSDMNQPQSFIVSSGDVIPDIKFSTNRIGGKTTFNWINTNTSIGLDAFGSGTILSFKALNNGNKPIVDTVLVTPVFENGGVSTQGNTRKFTITVLPDAQVDPIENIELCNGAIANITFSTNNLEGETSYKWTNDNSLIGLSLAGNGQIGSFKVNNPTSQALSAVVTVIPSYTYNGVSNVGKPEHFVIKVNPGAEITTQPVSSYICRGGKVDSLKVAYILGSGKATYQWYSNVSAANFGGTAISGATTASYLPSTLTVGKTYYYCVVSFESGACKDVVSNVATVSVNDAAYISTQPVKQQQICLGGTIAKPLSITYTGGSGKVSYQWYTNTLNSQSGATKIAGATDSVFTPETFTKPGSYYYFAELNMSGDGCGAVLSDISEVQVLADPVVIKQPLTSQVICKNTPPAELTVKATGGIGVFSYQWFKSQTSDVNSGVTIAYATDSIFLPTSDITGTTYYYCEISQPNGPNCSVKTEVAQIVVNPVPVITSQPVSAIICSAENAAELSVKYSNGVGKPLYQWYVNAENSNQGGTIIPGANGNTYKPDNIKVVTSYYYCVISFPDGGCSSLTSDVASVTVNPVSSISSRKISICNGAMFTLSPVGINNDFVAEGTKYIWSTPVVSPANAINGGVAQTIPISEINQKLINLTDSAATITYTITPLTGSCVGNAFTVEVSVLPTINPNAVVTNVTCNGANNGSIKTNIIGGIPFNTIQKYQVSWIGPNGFTATTKDISGLKPGKYEITINDDGGCPVTYQYNIYEPTALKINTDAKRDLICADSNTGKIDVTVTGGTQPYSYLWKKNGSYYANTEDVDSLEAGVYVLIVTDANGCGFQTESYIVNQPSAIDIKLVNKSDVSCFGDSTGVINVDVKGGTPMEKTSGNFDYDYTWSGPKGFMSQEKNLKNLTAGKYTLTVTDANDCNKTIEIQITEPSEIRIDTIVVPVTCYGANNASITLAVSGGTKPYNVSWSNFGKGLIQEHLAPGIYTATVTDANDCQRTISVRIPETEFSIHPVVNNVSCHGSNNGSIRLNISGGKKPVKVVWSDDATAGEVRNQLSAGIYTVTLHDAAPCDITESFLISEPNEIVLGAKVQNASDCDNAYSGDIFLTVRGGTAPYTYLWSNGNKTKDLMSVSSGKYYVIVTDSHGCTQTAQYEVFRQKPIGVTLKSALGFDCSLKKLKRTYIAQVEGGFAPYHIKWSAGTVSGANNEIMETSINSLVSLQVTDSLGCTNSTTFNVEVPAIGISYSLADCNKFNYQFYVNKSDIQINEISYAWDFGDGDAATTSSPSHLYKNAGNYKVRLTVSTATCSATFEEKIYVDPKTRLRLDREAKLCKGDSVTLKVSGAYSYKWSNGSFGEITTIKTAGDYSVIGISANGCVDTLNFEVNCYDLYNYSVQSDSDKVTSGGFPMHLWAENVPFTQYFWNFGDGNTAHGIDAYHTFNVTQDGFYDVVLTAINPNGCTEVSTKRIWIKVPELPNTFSPNGDGINEKFLENWDAKIYSRNGVLLYEGRNGWDGKYKGQNVTSGIYYYVIYYPTSMGTNTTSGFVRVIR